MNFFEHWLALQARVGGLLRRPDGRGFLNRVRECAAELAALAGPNADPLIFAMIRRDRGPRANYASYGSAHALHVAAVCGLLAKRSGWSVERQHRAVAAALTMNLAIIELQGELAARGGRPSAAERELIERHPEDSGALLRLAGLDDPEWLAAVEQHHERPGGLGYPARLQSPVDMAQLLHHVDIFMAKHAGRADRAPLPAPQAARDLYTASGGHPVAAMLIKEFGIYPPGCFVRLASGETAVVIRRGEHASMPIACAITNRRGDALGSPQRRDTAQKAHAICEVLADDQVRVQVAPDRLYRVRAVVSLIWELSPKA